MEKEDYAFLQVANPKYLSILKNDLKIPMVIVAESMENNVNYAIDDLSQSNFHGCCKICCISYAKFCLLQHRHFMLP